MWRAHRKTFVKQAGSSLFFGVIIQQKKRDFKIYCMKREEEEEEDRYKEKEAISWVTYVTQSLLLCLFVFNRNNRGFQ